MLVADYWSWLLAFIEFIGFIELKLIIDLDWVLDNGAFIASLSTTLSEP